MPTVNQSRFPRTLVEFPDPHQYQIYGGMENFSNWFQSSRFNVEREGVYSNLRLDYDTWGQYIRRKSDNAVLMGGWDFRTSNRYLTRPSAIEATLLHCNNNIPFEWWSCNTSENNVRRPNGFEAVYSDSLDLDQIVLYLWLEQYYRRVHNTLFYMGRHAWGDQALPELINLPQDYDIISGSLDTNEPTSKQDLLRNFFQGSGTMGNTTKNKRLLHLLEKIVLKFDELCKNERAYTWVWLNATLKQVVKRRKIGKRSHQYFVLTEKGVPVIWDEARKILEKYTGKEFVYVSDSLGLYPKKMCKSVWDYLGSFGATVTPDELRLVWKLSSLWDEQKEHDEILWDGEEKTWKHRTMLLNLKEKGTESAFKVTKTFLSKRHTVCRCASCNFYVRQKDLIDDWDLSGTTCKFCLDITKPNNFPTQATVIGGYHSHKLSWKYYYHRTPKEDPRSFCVGMEIEMHNNNKDLQEVKGAAKAAWKIVQAQQQIDKNLNPMYFETDASLSPGGFEMITNPMSLPYHQWYWSLMLPEIRKVAVGWNTEKFVGDQKERNNYGIHMTFSRRWWTDIQLARLTKFIDNPNNKDLIQALAQRKSIYNGEYLASSNATLKDKLVIRKGKIIQGVNKYQPINVKSTLVELRFFRTTLNTESFMKNLEWFFAFHEWVKTTPFNTTAQGFIEWLLKYQRGYGRYSNLYRYFARDVLPCKGGNIKNPWKDSFKMVHNSKPLVFPIEPELIQTNESIIQGDIECV